MARPGELTSFSVGQEVGAVVPRRGGGLVLAVRNGIAVASDTGEDFGLAAPVERDIRGNRMNDAKCDPAGRLLAGTTAFDFTPHSAALYRVEPDWSFQANSRRCHPVERHCVEPHGSQLYFIDSATQGVDVFDYDAGTGSVGNRRRLVTIERTHGVPDGMTTDSKGNLWVACFGGAAVRCFSPAGAQLDEVLFPVTQVTSCTFGRRRRSGSGCDLGCLPAEHRPVAEGAACGCDVRLPSRGGGMPAPSFAG